MATSYPLSTWIGLIGTPFLIATGQVLFKLTSAQTGKADLHGLIALVFNPLLISALALYGFGTIVWIYILKAVPLTVAYSFMGLTFCFVPLLALLFLGDAVTARYLIGAIFIVAGMLIINV